MRKAIRIAAIVVALIAVIAIALAVAANLLSERKRSRVVDVTVAPVAYASGDAVLARGKYLYRSRGCMECHGEDGAGRDVVDDPGGLHVKSPNISPGSGSVVKMYTEVDWVRTIRHGVTPARRPMILMPSKDYNRLTDEDLAAIVAYVRSLPPVAGTPADIRLPLILKAMYAFDVVKDDAQEIDHALPPSKPVPETVSVAHGQYVANMCTGCHGSGFSGGTIPGAPPDWPPAANLTSGEGSVLPRYDNVDKFKAMLRTGKRPDGSAVSTVMPFPTLANINDIDAEALYMFMKSLPPRPAGGR